ncbi:hypothetical protein BH23BAC1_BH23BAC1_24490 [soil metagenome]
MVHEFLMDYFSKPRHESGSVGKEVLVSQGLYDHQKPGFQAWEDHYEAMQRQEQ